MSEKFALPSVVYIVDDDVSFHTATRRRLQLAGYEVQVYSCAEQFLDQQRDDSHLAAFSSMSGYPALAARNYKRLHEASSDAPSCVCFRLQRYQDKSCRHSRPVRKIF